MRRAWFSKPYADLVARLRVPSGFLLVAAFAWLADPAPASLLWGVPISLLGLLIRGWAAGHLAKNEALATSGPYSFVRNPLYIGTVLVAAGLVIASRRWELAAVFSGVFVCVYLPVIELEEQHLRNLFPDYADYAARVPMLMPRYSGSRNPAPFRWKLFHKNQEYQAVLGYLAGLVLLIFKASR